MNKNTLYSLMLLLTCSAVSCGPSKAPRAPRGENTSSETIPRSTEGQASEGEAARSDENRPLLSKEQIDAQIESALVGTWTSASFSFRFGKGPPDPRGTSAFLEVTWRRGEITRIVRKLPGEEWQIQQTFHYCGGLLCRVEQRERIEAEGKPERDGPPAETQRDYRAYLDDDRIFGQTAFEQSAPPSAESSPQTDIPHDPEVLKALASEGRRLLEETIKERVPQVAAGDLFSDTSAAARAVKDSLPYVTVKKDQLVLARVVDWLSPEDLAGATAWIDGDPREAVIRFDELKKIEAFKNAKPFWFLLGKPMVLYSNAGHSRLVHIDSLSIRAPLSHVTKDTRIEEILTGPRAYIGAGIQESLKPRHGWTWGHYAGFEIPRDISIDPKEIETLDAAFEEQFDIGTLRGKFEHLYEKNYTGRSPRYDFYFRFSHVVETEYPEHEYNLNAYQVLFRRRDSGAVEDWTDAFRDLFKREAVPFEAVTADALGGTLFLFHGRSTSVNLVLYRNGKLVPLVPLTDDVGIFGTRLHPFGDYPLPVSFGDGLK